MFKVGDKVCDPIRGGNGAVDSIRDSSYRHSQVTVIFEGGQRHYYRMDGFYHDTHNLPSLYHGHMEEGSGQITFTPKKEPDYEWQWLVKKMDGTFMVSAFREFSEDHVKGELCSDGSVWHYRIEESKREVKP